MCCVKCGSDNREGRKFCAECGTALAAKCPRCGASNEAAEKFCGECGAALAASASRATARNSGEPQIRITDKPAPQNIEGERKTVTALFADIKGSTELEQDLDPEDARRIVDPALKLMIDAVHRYDGYVVQSTGDGIFALFGAPVAHEDHPQRALYAALRMQDELRRYSTKLREAGNLPIEARVGVNTGEVVVRSIATGKDQTEYTPIGHTTNLASRMQVLAPTGSIALSEQTRKLVEGYFALRPLGPTKIKGVSEPVNVYEVTGLGPLRTRLQRAAGRGLTKFVGRAHEMEALSHAAERAKSGHGQIVAAMAEAGTGKSRLLFEFKAKNQSGWKVLETFSVSHGKASAYFPVIDLLHNYFKITGEDDQRARRAKITGNVLTLDRSLEDTLPYIFALLGVSEEDNPLASMDAQVRRRRTLDGVKRLLLRESLNQPIMLIFEDLHWIDEETQGFLNLLADSIGTAEILLLVNYRPEYSHSWNSKTYYTQLRLDPLGRESAEEMLASLLGDGAEIVPLKRVIIQRTDGNPFFMEETVQVLLDEGILVRNGLVRLTKPLNDLKIPPTVQAILAARIDRLPIGEKNLLQTLAVIGMEFPLSIVREIAKAGEDELNRMLNDLQLAEFIYEQPAVADVEYTFKHGLTQEVAENSVLAERRRMIHEQVGHAVEALYADHLEDHYSELARHYSIGNDPEKALRYTQLAVVQAIDRAAYSEARNLIDAGLRIIDKLPDERARLQAELSLRAAESSVAFVMHGAASPPRERAIKRLCELAEKTGETDQLLRARISLSQMYFTQQESRRGLEVARQCFQLARNSQNVNLLIDTYYAAGCSADSCGSFAEAISYYDEGIRLADSEPNAVSLWVIRLGSGILCQSSASRFILGRIVEAEKVAEAGMNAARQSGHLFSLGHALTTAGWWMTRLQRNFNRMLADAEEQIAFSSEQGLYEWLHWGRFSRGEALAGLGRLKEGIADMEAGVSAFAQSGGAPGHQFAIAVLAAAYATTGRIDEAIATLRAVEKHIEASGEKAYLPEVLRLKGEVTLMRDRSAIAEAESCFRDSVELARAQSARWWELRTGTSLARSLRDNGRCEEARAMLAEIYGGFTEGLDLPDLRDAKALLEKLS